VYKVNQHPEGETLNLGSKNDWGWAIESNIEHTKVVWLGFSIVCYVLNKSVVSRCARCAAQTHCKFKTNNFCKCLITLCVWTVTSMWFCNASAELRFTYAGGIVSAGISQHSATFTLWITQLFGGSGDCRHKYWKACCTAWDVCMFVVRSEKVFRATKLYRVELSYHYLLL
jgi:hypothetical protein